MCRMSSYIRRWHSFVIAVGLVIGLQVLTSAPAYAQVDMVAPRQTAHLQISQLAPDPSSGKFTVDAITAISRTDIWAGGFKVGNASSYSVVPVLEHFDGKHWNLIPSPTVTGDAEVIALASVTTNNVWAALNVFGSSAYSESIMLEHWNGSSWSIINYPAPKVQAGLIASLTQLVANTSGVWITGDYTYNSGMSPNRSSATNGGLIADWFDGHTWHSGVSGLNIQFPLASLTAIGTDNAWATDQSVTRLLHWDGTRWSSALTMPGAYFTSISASTANDGWAVGNDSAYTHGIAEHWDGHSWQSVTAAKPSIGTGTYQLNTVYDLCSCDAWAVGETFPGDDSHAMQLLEHWNGQVWSVIDEADLTLGLNGLTTPLPTTRTLISLGRYQNRSVLFAVSY